MALLDDIERISQIGAETYHTVTNRNNQGSAPITNPAPAPASTGFNWKPWAIGGAALLVVVVLLVTLTGKKA